MTITSQRPGRYQALWARKPVMWTLVRRDLRVRYARSFLGYVWTILDPLAMALIYFMVFAVIFKRKDVGFYHPYFLFLLIGLLAWQWFNASVTETGRALLAEAKLVRSTSLPREMWVIRVVLAKGVEFLLSLPVLLAFAIYYVWHGDTHVNWRLCLFPLAIAVQFLLQIGIGLLLAPVTVLVEDTNRVVRILMRILFYCTPIIYALNGIPHWLRRLLEINPMSGVLELYRAGLFAAPLNLHAIVIGLAGTVAALVAGVVVFGRLERAVLKEI